jgi:hypothetical protein
MTGGRRSRSRSHDDGRVSGAGWSNYPCYRPTHSLRPAERFIVPTTQHVFVAKVGSCSISLTGEIAPDGCPTRRGKPHPLASMDATGAARPADPRPMTPAGAMLPGPSRPWATSTSARMSKNPKVMTRFARRGRREGVRAGGFPVPGALSPLGEGG